MLRWLISQPEMDCYKNQCCSTQGYRMDTRLVSACIIDPKGFLIKIEGRLPGHFQHRQSSMTRQTFRVSEMKYHLYHEGSSDGR
jgi:hypothetical protein